MNLVFNERAFVSDNPWERICSLRFLKKLWYLLPMTFKEGTLWQEVVRVTENALGSGALLPVPTEYEFIDDNNIRFFVRILSGLRRKDEAKKQQEKEAATTGRQVNPFLPYEKDLFVASISDTHVAILNKFNVVEHHLLLVTRDFEDQETLLTLQDFDALFTCMTEYDSLGFYNGGEAAGASQRHKHLQIIPIPLAPEGPQLPIDPPLDEAVIEDDFGIIPAFPFLHVYAKIVPEVLKPTYDTAEKTFNIYCEMLQRVGMTSPEREGLKKQSRPYCLLVTRKWMLLIPRSQEFFDSISVNSLGFAGALLVRNKEQLDMVKSYGPMNILRDVSLPVSEKQG
jgi:ATP adenylyltransferase